MQEARSQVQEQNRISVHPDVAYQNQLSTLQVYMPNYPHAPALTQQPQHQPVMNLGWRIPIGDVPHPGTVSQHGSTYPQVPRSRHSYTNASEYTNGFASTVQNQLGGQCQAQHPHLQTPYKVRSLPSCKNCIETPNGRIFCRGCVRVNHLSTTKLSTETRNQVSCSFTSPIRILLPDSSTVYPLRVHPHYA